jgi:dihydrofolate reductase
MSRISLQTHVTLDGVIESPPEALLPYMSDEGRQSTLELALASDGLLLGRVTWQQLAPAWREQTGAMAERLNAMPKYVVTSTLGAATEWGNSEIVTYGEIAALREHLDLLSYGCGALARDLLRDGLLDELHLNMTAPVRRALGVVGFRTGRHPHLPDWRRPPGLPPAGPGAGRVARAHCGYAAIASAPVTTPSCPT